MIDEDFVNKKKANERIEAGRPRNLMEHPPRETQSITPTPKILNLPQN